MNDYSLCALSLAFQRSFPRVFQHVRELRARHRKGDAPQLAWPEWCCFPIGLSHDLLKSRYGYDGDGVEPYLLSALVAWQADRDMLRCDPDLLCAGEGPVINGIPATALQAQPWRSLYLRYRENVRKALGTFVFMNYNGPGQEDLVFLFHLETYRVEPMLFSLSRSGRVLGDLDEDLGRAVRAGCPKAADDELFDTLMTLCRANLGVLQELCTLPGTAGVQTELRQ